MGAAELEPVGARARGRERGDANEERDFLFLYLRDYADPTGTLPVDFDGLVRESFADLLGPATG